MDRDLVNLLLLVFLDLLDFFEVLVRFFRFSDSLEALWCYSETLRDVTVISTVTALKLELWLFKIDFDAMFSELSISQKDGCVSEFHDI